MDKNRLKKRSSFLSRNIKKQKKEVLLIMFIIFVMIILTYAENSIIHFGGEFPVSNTILMFILINVNLLLLILLIFLVFRNLAKLVYDRKQKVMGAKLRTRLVVAFIGISLLPTTVLFFFSINFISTSIEFWFNVPIEQALENSLQVGRQLYTYIEDRNSFFLKRIDYQINARDFLNKDKSDALLHYIQVVLREFNLQAVEIYDENAKRLVFVRVPELQHMPFDPVSAQTLRKDIKPDKSFSFSEDISAGELNRTVGTIPFGAAPPPCQRFYYHICTYFS